MLSFRTSADVEKFDKQMLKCKYTPCMMLSSCFFLYPIYYGLSCQIYGHSLLLLACWLVSINYWRNPIVSTRRNIDIVVCNSTLLLYIVDSFRYVRNPIYVIVGFPNIVLSLYVFHISTIIFDKQQNHWWKYHVLFHFLCSINQYFLLDEMCFYNNREHS
jgi:hypothetical protein